MGRKEKERRAQWGEREEIWVAEEESDFLAWWGKKKKETGQLRARGDG